MLGKRNLPGFAGLLVGLPSLMIIAIDPMFAMYIALGAIALGIAGLAISKNDVPGSIGLMCGVSTIVRILYQHLHMSPLNHIEYLVLLAVIGYGFAIANECIGISNIKDLNQLKSQLGLARLHKIYGRVETVLFLTISAICITEPLKLLAFDLPSTVPPPPGILQPPLIAYPTVFWHTFIGGILPFGLFLVKVIPAFGNKDAIFKYGMVLGPIGFVAWTLAYFTSLIDYFFLVVPGLPMIFTPPPLVLPNMPWAIATSVAIGLILFLYAKTFNARATGTGITPKTHGVALILHGVSFGYETAAKELVGAPVLYKYVYPYTYKSLDKLSIFLGLDIEALKKMDVNEALELYMKKCASIGMAEQIKVKWTSADSFSVESINCSTAAVRSKIPKEEIKGSICPWALLAASLFNKLTGKDLEISASEFNEIGARTELKVKDARA
ncbi:MAG: hypothetical protein GYA24_03290 [Candidatus Lokiarchaeota archaeon]|nr:hypothetical protein [Candidatus Lokiarchaeota archaeon]